MKRLNHYQKDILFLLIVIGAQMFFSLFYPFRNPAAETSIHVHQRFIFLEFEFVNLNESTLYIPFIAIFFVISLIFLLIQKRKRYALIYGFALALVAKAYYLTELFALSGNTYSDLSINGTFSQRIVSGGEVLAHDITMYILVILIVIKTGIYVHDYYMKKRSINTNI